MKSTLYTSLLMLSICVQTTFAQTLTQTSIQTLAQTSTIPTEGVVASYTFEDDKKGVVYDQIGGNNGKATKVKYTDGVIGKAAQFNGVNSKIIINKVDGTLPQSITDLKVGTVSFWIKFENRGGQVLPIIYLGKSDSSMPSRSMIFEVGHDKGSIENRRLYFTSIISQSNNFCVDSGMNLEEGKWYHYAAVVSDQGSTIYLNGVEIMNRRYNLGSTTQCSVFFDDVPNKEILSIGYGHYSQEEPFFSFNGLIDDILIYDRALSYDEVMALFNAAGLKMGDPKLGFIDAASMEGKTPIERGGRSTQNSGRSMQGNRQGNNRQGNMRNQNNMRKSM